MCVVSTDVFCRRLQCIYGAATRICICFMYFLAPDLHVEEVFSASSSCPVPRCKDGVGPVHDRKLIERNLNCYCVRLLIGFRAHLGLQAK
jgi:hypothetical protein